MKTKIAVVIFSLLVLGVIGLLMVLEERDVRLVAVAPTPTRTPTKTPRPTLSLLPTLTPQTPGASPSGRPTQPIQPTQPTLPPPTTAVTRRPGATATPQAPPTGTSSAYPGATEAPTGQPTTVTSGLPLTPQPWPTPVPTTPMSTRTPAPTARPQPTKAPTATLIPLKQFVGEVSWLTSYSPNCGSIGIGKRFSRVIDAQGKPVAGVVIKLWWADASPDQYIYSDPTGNDGAFEIALGVPRDFTAYVTVHSHWGNPVESSDVLTIEFQGARGKDCLTVADGGTGLGHQWAIVVFKKQW